MSLNIKNERTHALVRQLAELTGESQTSAVEGAVRARIDALVAEQKRDDQEVTTRRERADAVLASFRADLSHADRAALRGAEGALYDDAGLPA